MKFALVGPSYPLRGGIAQYTTSLYHCLSRQYSVLLVSFRRQYPALLFPGNSQQDLSHSAYRAEGEAILDTLSPRTWERAARRLAEFGPDLVLFQWWHPWFAPAYAGLIRRLRRKRPQPVFFLCHNVFPHERFRMPGYSLVERHLIGLALRQADGFLVHSEALRKEVRIFNHQAPIRCIYHPVYDFYSRWKPEREKPPDSTARLLYFGKVRRYKGLEVFLRALALVKGRVDYRAVVAGEFYVSSEPYRRLAEELGIAGCIEWHDRYIPNHEVPSLFLQADLVVLPYLEATQSGVVPLAYHFEVPVVASNVGGLSEVVLDGQTGYLAAPGDPEDLAEKIASYFRGEEKGAFQKNIRTFRERLSWQQVVDNVLALLKERGDSPA